MHVPSPGPGDERRSVPRRALLVAGGTVVAAGAAALATGVVSPRRLRARLFPSGPQGSIPDAPAGRVALVQRRSEARDRDVGFFTAVPAGFGDGTGLPVCFVLHGASATTADYERFGLPQFLTAAVETGAPPFVLVGADGGRTRWAGDGDRDDPQRMLREELPAWCGELGFDASRVAAHGWSMGGYGSLLLAIRHPGWLRAVAVLSPAVGGGEVGERTAELDGDRVAIWCGTDDDVYPAVQDLAAAIPGGAAVAEYESGAGHTRGYWNTVTPAALAFVGARLAA